MATAPKKSGTPAPTPAPQTPMAMVHGFAVQIIGFVPIPKDDLRKQAEIPLLLLDIQEGKKTLSDLVPHLRGLEFRQQHVGRRVTAAEAAEWRRDPNQTDLEDFIPKGSPHREQEADDEQGD